jgi:leucyl/phenylalanyl-tRNA--protein transferase
VTLPLEPIEPEDTGIRFPDLRRAPASGLVAVGVDFRPGTVLRAYRNGIFPWPQSEDQVGWFSPHPRTIFPLEKPLHWSRSLRRTLRTHPFRISVNTAFEEVMNACGTARPGGTWIIPELIAGYVKLHELGWAHSLEVWENELLVGGIYGVSVGAAFAGESMFHRRTDASKIAFATLAERLKESGYLLFDAQVKNPHLTSLGCVEIKRTDYLERLAKAVATVPRVRINAWR